MESWSSHLTNLIGKFSVIKWPSVNITTKLTSNSTLKVLVAIVGHVNSLGNTIKIGTTIPRGISPSLICIFCISVASLAYPLAHPLMIYRYLFNLP